MRQMIRRWATCSSDDRKCKRHMYRGLSDTPDELAQSNLALAANVSFHKVCVNMFLNAWNSITYAEWRRERRRLLVNIVKCLWFLLFTGGTQHRVFLSEKISSFPQVASLNPLMSVSLISFFPVNLKINYCTCSHRKTTLRRKTTKSKFNFSEVTLFYATWKSSFAFNILQLCLLR